MSIRPMAFPMCHLVITRTRTDLTVLHPQRSGSKDEMGKPIHLFILWGSQDIYNARTAYGWCPKLFSLASLLTLAVYPPLTLTGHVVNVNRLYQPSRSNFVQNNIFCIIMIQAFKIPPSLFFIFDWRGSRLISIFRNRAASSCHVR